MPGVSKKNPATLWERVGLGSDRMQSLLRFDCDANLEIRLQAFMVREHSFYRNNRDFLASEFFATESGALFAYAVSRFFDDHRAPPDYSSLVDYARRFLGLQDKQLQMLLPHAAAVFGTQLVGKDYAERTLREMGRKRALRAAACRISAIADDPDGGLDEIQDTMQAALALVNRGKSQPYFLREDYPGIINTFVRMSQGIPTGLGYLDSLLGSGLLKGELGLIVAGYKVGKTLALLNFALGALIMGHNALFISYEDGKDVIRFRLCQCLLGWTKEEIGANPERALQSLGTFLAMQNADIAIDEQPADASGVADLEAVIGELEATRGWKPDVVFLDYADKMRPPHRYSDEGWRELTKLYTVLRALAKRMDFACWTASQTNRPPKVTGKGVQAAEDGSRIAGSYGKWGEVDVGLMYFQDAKERERGAARFKLEACRNRDSGEYVSVSVDRARSRIRGTPPPLTAGGGSGGP